jgi:hypothetical protein
VHVHEQGQHANVTRYGEDIDGGGRLLANVDFLVRDVIANSQCLYSRSRRTISFIFSHLFSAVVTSSVEGSSYRGDSDPAWQEEARIVEPAGEGEHGRGHVGVDDVDGKQTDHCRLRCIVDQPPRHEAVREEERQVPGGKAPYGRQHRLGQRHLPIVVDAGPILSLDSNLEQAQQQMEDRRRPPPDGGQDGAQAQGEEPRMPWRRHIQSNGDAGLEERGLPRAAAVASFIL